MKKTTKQPKDMKVSELAMAVSEGFIRANMKVSELAVTVSDLAVTVSDLAAMVANGFVETQTMLREEMHEMEERLDARISGVDHTVKQVHTAVLGLSFDHRKMKSRLENVEVKVFGSVQEA